MKLRLEKIDRFRCRYEDISGLIDKYAKDNHYLKYFLDDVWDKDLNDYVIECVVDVYKPIRLETLHY